MKEKKLSTLLRVFLENSTFFYKILNSLLNGDDNVEVIHHLRKFRNNDYDVFCNVFYDHQLHF